MPANDDALYANPRLTIAVWCWVQIDATMEGVSRLLYLLHTRNLWNAEIPPHLQGWGPGYHIDGGSLFLERLWLYHAAKILRLVYDLSTPWLILDEGSQPGQVWPGVLRLLRNFFFPPQLTRSPPYVPPRRPRAAQPIDIVTLPTITGVSSDEELFGSLTSVSEDEEEELPLLFGPMSPDQGACPEMMMFADEDLYDSPPMTPPENGRQMIVSSDEELHGPMSPPRANPVMIVTLPDDDFVAPIQPVTITEVVAIDEDDLSPSMPPVTITEIFPDSDLF